MSKPVTLKSSISSARQPLDDALRGQWASLAQVLVLSEMMRAQNWTVHDLAFQGGTSLHLSWGSPRFSEDLDFLLNQDLAADLPALMAKVEKRVQEAVLAHDPRMHIEIRNKTKDPQRMGNYHVVVTRDDVIGRAMVKVEFWTVSQAYLSRYPMEFRSPMREGDLVARSSAMVPAASLTNALADKITALAGRERLKWRDFFDIWWIMNHTRALSHTLPQIVLGSSSVPDSARAPVHRLIPKAVFDQYLVNRTAYDQAGNIQADIERLSVILNTDNKVLAEMAASDLKPFLPESYWRQIQGLGIQQIIDHVKAVTQEIRDALHVDQSKRLAATIRQSLLQGQVAGSDPVQPSRSRECDS